MIWVSPGNSTESLDQFFTILGPDRCSKIKTVSKDMHFAYIHSCRQYIPDAIEVADPFHVVQRINQAIDECRQQASLGSSLRIGKNKIIFNLQWLLRRKNEQLGKQGRLSLEKLAKSNQSLYHCYLLKESFYELYTFEHHQINLARAF